MLPMSLAMLALGIRTLEPDVDAAMLLAAIGMGALTGLAVALVEETFFRGLMFRAVFRESGLAVAALATALLYSAIHFLARVRLPQDEISWDSGLALLGVAFSRFADPASIVDSFITLALVGLLLALVRHRTGSIAAGIGLHMGWVCVIKATTGVTADNADGNWSFLVSSFDGYTGWLVAAWAAILIAVAWAGTGPAVLDLLIGDHVKKPRPVERAPRADAPQVRSETPDSMRTILPSFLRLTIIAPSREPLAKASRVWTTRMSSFS
jgi:hypothetical protein